MSRLESVYKPIISHRNGLRGGDIETKYNMLKKGSKYDGNNKGGDDYKKEDFKLDLKWLSESFLQDMKFLDEGEAHFKHPKILHDIKYKREQTKLSYLAEVTRIYENQSAWTLTVLQSLFEERLLSYIPDIQNYIDFSNAWELKSKSIGGSKQAKDEEEWFSDLLDKKTKNGIFGDYEYGDLWTPLAKGIKENFMEKPRIVSISDEGSVSLGDGMDFGYKNKIHYIPWVIFVLKNITGEFNSNIQIQFSNNIIAKYRNSEYSSGWEFIKGTHNAGEYNDYWEEHEIDGLIDFNL